MMKHIGRSNNQSNCTTQSILTAPGTNDITPFTSSGPLEELIKLHDSIHLYRSRVKVLQDKRVEGVKGRSAMPIFFKVGFWFLVKVRSMGGLVEEERFHV